MRLYRFLKKKRTLINSILITVFTSLFFNSLSDSDYGISDISKVVDDCFSIKNISGILTIASVILIILINAVIIICELVVNHYNLETKFTDIMKEKTDVRIRDSIKPGIFSWGNNKTVEICEEILYGWKSDCIVVTEYKDEEYIFSPDNQNFNVNGYKEYFESKEFQDKFVKSGNNLPRFMLTGCKPNFNRNSRKLELYIRRTEWSACQYVWSRFRNNPTLLAEYAEGIVAGKTSAEHLPNSLCLHLILETSDGKIITSKISPTKFNDHAGTWAVTLGEQIESSDFTDGNTSKANFVFDWVKRAFEEEYKITGELYNDIVSDKNIRILSVDFEGDIYNFSLVCFVTLNITYKKFYEILKTRLLTAEATEIRPLEYSDIPNILINYPQNKADYHDSSYLRMMLAYMHRFGIDKLQRDIVNEYKKAKSNK